MSINVSNITTANFHIVLYTLNIEYFTLKFFYYWTFKLCSVRKIPVFKLKKLTPTLSSKTSYFNVAITLISVLL